MTKVNLLKTFEFFVLKTIWMLNIVYSVICFYNLNWIMGLFLLSTLLYIGYIGSNLDHNKHKDFKELSKGSKWIFKDVDVFTHDKSRSLVKGFYQVTFMLLVEIIFTHYFDSNGNDLLWVGILFAILYPIVMTMLGVQIVKLIER